MSDIRFLSSDPPNLPAGHYLVRVGQRLQSGVLDAQLGNLAGAADLQFAASGPRTALPPHAVVARYPVAGSSGRVAGALPHLVLDDPMLPWLRRPWNPWADPAASWLALILLAGPELDLVGRRTATAGGLGRALEPGEQGDAVVNLLSLPAGLAAQVLPSPQDLPFLSHVRETDGPDGGRHGVIVGNRLPRSGIRNEVHLVSLEDVPIARPAGSAVELVSLDHWQFDSVDHGGDFRDLAIVAAQHCGPLRQETGVAAADDQLRRGVVALSYQGHLAWYRGPLSPVTDDPAGRAVGAAFDHDLPRSAEELLLFDEQLQMVDATYAVAWDLGRALTVADGHAARALDAFWRARRQWTNNSGALQDLVQHRQREPEPSPEVIAWFQSLFDLSAVPSRYLLADPDRLIPLTPGPRGVAGRLGFFAVDPIWVSVMAFGAASVGVVTARERQELAKLDLHGPALAGFVLRSELVAWDDLRIRVWAGSPTAGAPLPIVARDLGADLRLVLVESEAASFTVELARAAHGWHFGIEEVSAPMRKYPRDGNGEVAPGAGVNVPERHGADGTVAIADLAALLSAGDAATFARHMVLGSPTVQFQLDVVAPG